MIDYSELSVQEIIQKFEDRQEKLKRAGQARWRNKTPEEIRAHMSVMGRNSQISRRALRLKNQI